jgi:hypothetical protein
MGEECSSSNFIQKLHCFALLQIYGSYIFYFLFLMLITESYSILMNEIY